MLALPPQRVDRSKTLPVDPASLFDWQQQITVQFDGTANTPFGRQLFVPEERRKAPPKLAQINGRARSFLVPR